MVIFDLKLNFDLQTPIDHIHYLVIDAAGVYRSAFISVVIIPLL